MKENRYQKVQKIKRDQKHTLITKIQPIDSISEFDLRFLEAKRLHRKRDGRRCERRKRKMNSLVHKVYSNGKKELNGSVYSIEYNPRPI